MRRSPFAVALAAALVLLGPVKLHADAAARLDLDQGWRHAETLPELIGILDGWLDRNGEWARREVPARVRFVSAAEAAARQGRTASLQRGRLRGLYDPDRAEILLVQPWDPRDAGDVSVLLHELVHHRQAPHHWYCPAAQELPAYRLQENWLAERGVPAEINWLAVVLDAGCTPRDIHPE